MISKKSFINKYANLDSSVQVGHNTFIDKDVKIGKNVKISANVFITGNTIISDGCEIYPFACIGTSPQHLKFKGEGTKVFIGKDCIIREFVTINRGTEESGGITTVGSKCLLMTSSHVGHDSKIGNKVVFANNVAIAGHVEIDDNVIIGGNSAVQQFTRIGKLAIVGGMTGVEKDVIPYGFVIGNRSHLHGVNIIGLKRHNYESKEITILKKSIDLIFSNKLLKNGIKEAKKFNKFQTVKEVISFLEKSKKRPICRP
jgi:UDP-N-acetylglucosamine acyltransferase